MSVRRPTVPVIQSVQTTDTTAVVDSIRNLCTHTIDQYPTECTCIWNTDSQVATFRYYPAGQTRENPSEEQNMSSITFNDAKELFKESDREAHAEMIDKLESAVQFVNGFQEEEEEEENTLQWEEQNMTITTFKDSKELFKVKNRKYLSNIINTITSSITTEKLKRYSILVSNMNDVCHQVLELNSKIHFIRESLISNEPLRDNDIKSSMSYYSEKAQGLSESLLEISHRLKEDRFKLEKFRQQTLDIIGNLASLRDIAKIDYEDEGIFFTYRTEPICLEFDEYSVNLGEFDILVSFRRGMQPNIDVKAIDPNPSDDGGYHHPHVADEVMCLGHAENKVDYMLSQFMIVDLFDVLEIMLKTYNPNSPYRTLEEWHVEYECSECGKSMTGDEYKRCYCCDGILCEDCLTTVRGAGVYVCSTCAKRYHCDICKEYKLGVVDLDCCNKRTCSECLSEESIKCRICGNYIHTECAEHCKECDFLVCSNCMDSYKDEEMCEQCVQKKMREEREDGKEE
jgi:hypothetical protein